jgi:HAD superfamily hydrolase (TIGR01509 family)
MTNHSNPIFIDYESNARVDLIEYLRNKSIKVAYWDIGGTLVDVPESIKQKNIEAINNTCKCHITLAMYDYLIREEWKRRETPEAQRKIKSVKTDEDELDYWIDFFTKAFKKYNIQKATKLLRKLAKTYANANSFECYPYVERTLEEVKDMGIKIGIISNAFRSARRILKQKNLIEKIVSEYIFLSCEYNSIKPEENIYKKAVDKTGVCVKEIVFIDDRESFLGQARKLGMNTLVIKHEMQTYMPFQDNMLEQP